LKDVQLKPVLKKIGDVIVEGEHIIDIVNAGREIYSTLSKAGANDQEFDELQKCVSAISDPTDRENAQRSLNEAREEVRGKAMGSFIWGSLAGAAGGFALGPLVSIVGAFAGGEAMGWLIEEDIAQWMQKARDTCKTLQSLTANVKFGCKDKIVSQDSVYYKTSTDVESFTGQVRFYIFPSGWIGTSTIEKVSPLPSPGKGSYSWSFNGYSRKNVEPIFWPNTAITQGNSGGEVPFSVWGSYDVETKKINWFNAGMDPSPAKTGIKKLTIYYDSGTIHESTFQSSSRCSGSNDGKDNLYYESTSDSSSRFLRPGETLTSTRSDSGAGGNKNVYFSVTLSK
jgi:hypothetical protein